MNETYLGDGKVKVINDNGGAHLWNAYSEYKSISDDMWVDY